MHDTLDGLNVGVIKVNNLRYAVDTTSSETNDDLRVLLLRVQEEREKAGLYLNIKKTKVMTTNDSVHFKIGDEIIEVGDCFIFLGSLIHKDGKSDKEITRIMMGEMQ